MQTGRAHRGANTVLAFVVVFVVVAGAIGGYWVYNRVSHPQTPIITSSTPTSSSTTSSDGIRLEESVNTSSIVGFQRLNISVSLFNTRQSVNSIPVADDWYFTGVPVSLPGGSPLSGSGYPANMLVLRGNYSLQQLRSGQNLTFTGGCEGSCGITHQVTFQPNSDKANVTETVFPAGVNQTLGPFRMALSFTTDGSWDAHDLEMEDQTNVPVVGADEQLSPVYTTFSPGVYTIAVADQWGQAVVLHITVVPATGIASTSTSTSCSRSPPGGSCAALYSYTFTVFVNYSGRWMVSYSGYNGSGPQSPVLVNGTYAGVGPYSSSVTLTGNNDQSPTLCATAQKLDPSSATLTLTLTGSNQTSAFYGKVTYCGGVTP